jgi:hypothetical protein
MEASKSTDKLLSMTMILDKIIDKLNADKVDENGYRIEHPLPILKLEFH